MIYTLLSTKIKNHLVFICNIQKRNPFKIERSTRKKKYLEHIENYCFENLKKFKILRDNI